MSTEIAKGSVGLSIDRAKLEKDVLLATESTGTKAGALLSSKFGGALSKLGKTGEGFGLPFAGAVGKVGDKMDETGSKAAGFGKLLGGAAVPTLALAAGVAAIGGEALKLGSEMQGADAAIAAHAGTSVKAATDIGNAFLDTAGKSTFSGQQMAVAFAPVAGQLGQMQGHALSAAQATQVMAAAADLAEASGSDLGTTTASLANVMQSYGIGVAGAADASNTLWNATRLTGTSVDSFAQMAQRLRARLGDLTPSLSDTSALLLDLKNHGETGRTAMSAMSSGFSTLLSGAKPVTEELKTLGIKIFDSSGKFVGMQSVIAQLSPKLAGMSQAQQHAAEQALFGKTAASQLSATLLAGVPAFTAASAAVTKHGSVASSAKQMSGTFEGQVKTLKATAIDLGTKLGQALIPMVIKVGQVVTKVTEFFIAHKAVAIALAVILADVLTGGLSTVLIAVTLIWKNWSRIWTDIKNWTQDGVRFVVDAFLDMAGLIIHAAADAFGWVPGIGGKLKDAAKHFDEFKTSVDASLGDTHAQLKNASNQMDDFNKKASSMGSAIRQTSAGAAGTASTFTAGVGSSTGVTRMMAIGGLVQSRTSATIGESGAEAVIPLTDPIAAARVVAQTQMAGYSWPSAHGSGQGGGITIENLTVTAPTAADTPAVIARGLRKAAYLNGR